MQAEAVQKSETLTFPALEHLQLLIVDDEPSVCETLQLYFQRLGIKKVQIAYSGPEAIDAVAEHPYDFMFVDLIMPEMNGMEVLKQIREHHLLTNVIVMTGYPSMEIVIDAIRNGASDFLVKPFRYHEVKLSLEKIQRLHFLMQKNWALKQELEKKKEVEELNKQLEKRIRHQTILYNIVDSLSKISQSEDLYKHVVKKAAESCNAEKACFMIYDAGGNSLLVLAQQGIKTIFPGIQTRLLRDGNGRSALGRDFISAHFDKPEGPSVSLERTVREKGFISVPFKIRNQPFGLLLVSEKTEKLEFDQEDEFILNFLSEKTSLNIENFALYDSIKQSLIATLRSLVSAIEAKDPYTQKHSTRVTEYAIRIALEMGLSPEDQQKIKSCGPLHDIGKIGINDYILNKAERLTAEEFSHIKAHPIIGVNIVSPLGLDRDELAIIRNHHERWDGEGYPDGLEMDYIPGLARILAVADAFDAMSSDRAYRNSLPLNTCLKEIKNNSGSQFDPDVVEAALFVLKK
jgi:putative nucleotidyltransferase with HDIG domain